MLTNDGLIRGGFKAFTPNQHLGDTWTVGFQFRVRDEKGIRYHVQVYAYDNREWKRNDQNQGMPDWGYEVEVVYNEMKSFSPPSALMVKAFAGTNTWTVEDVLKWADEVWKRLQPEYYEQHC